MYGSMATVIVPGVIVPRSLPLAEAAGEAAGPLEQATTDTQVVSSSAAHQGFLSRAMTHVPFAGG
jgi:hypothetical protein